MIKKILFTMGGAIAIAMPIVTVISCGDNGEVPKPTPKTDQEKMNGIDKQMVNDAITNEVYIEEAVPANVPKNVASFHTTLNGLDGVHVVISAWVPDGDIGTATMKAAISKDSLTPPIDSPFNIVIKGFAVTLTNSNMKKNASFDNTKKILKIYDNVTVIGDRTTLYWKNLTGITSNNDIKKITLPSNLITLRQYSFDDNFLSLTSLVIPNKVTTIEDGVFGQGGINIHSLTIGTSVNTIGYGAFWGAHLTHLIVPDKDIIIGFGAFKFIINDSKTTVSMPKKFNTDKEKNRIFDVGHWNNINFTWYK